MTTDQVLAAAATITAACVVVAVVVIVWAFRADKRDRARREGYEAGYADCLNLAVDMYAPGADQPEARLLWMTSLAPPDGEVPS